MVVEAGGDELRVELEKVARGEVISGYLVEELG